MTLQHGDLSVTDNKRQCVIVVVPLTMHNRLDLTICYDLSLLNHSEAVLLVSLYTETIIISHDCVKIIMTEFTYLSE